MRRHVGRGLRFLGLGLLACGAPLVLAAPFLHQISVTHGVYNDLAANARTAPAWNWVVMHSWLLTWVVLIGGAVLVVVQQMRTDRKIRSIERAVHEPANHVAESRCSAGGGDTGVNAVRAQSEALFLACYQQQWEHIRHIERIRFVFTSFYVALITASAAYFASGLETVPKPLLAIILAVSIAGFVICHRTNRTIVLHRDVGRDMATKLTNSSAETKQYMPFFEDAEWYEIWKIRVIFLWLYAIGSACAIGILAWQVGWFPI